MKIKKTKTQKSASQGLDGATSVEQVKNEVTPETPSTHEGVKTEPDTSLTREPKAKKRRRLESSQNDDKLSSDEEIDPANKSKKKKLGSYKEKMSDDEMKKTIFIGNLPVGITRKDVEKLFSSFGTVVSARIRSIIPKKDGMWKKVAAIKNEISTEYKDCVHAYLKFKETASAIKALEMNGSLFSNRRLQIDSCGETVKYDSKRSVFVGNLPFTCKEDDLITHFTDCGDVERVRIVRESKTGAGKGFGFIVFKDASSVGLALKLNKENFEKRPLRVTRVVKKFGKKRTAQIKEKSKKIKRRSQSEQVKIEDASSPDRKQSKKIKKKKHASKQPSTFMS